MSNKIFPDSPSIETSQKVVESISEYWILDGSSSAYELRFELSRLGANFNKIHKNWSIKTTKDSQVYKTIRAMGLILQYRR